MSNPYRAEGITGAAQDEFKALIALSIVKNRALYLQLGGAHVEHCLERLCLSMSEGHDSFRRFLAQETADYAARCEDPALEPPRRERPALNAREALNLARETTELMELKRKLALQAARMANAGVEPAREFIEAAKASMAREAELAAQAVNKPAAIPPAPKPLPKARPEKAETRATPAVAAA